MTRTKNYSTQVHRETTSGIFGFQSSSKDFISGTSQEECGKGPLQQHRRTLVTLPGQVALRGLCGTGLGPWPWEKSGVTRKPRSFSSGNYPSVGWWGRLLRTLRRTWGFQPQAIGASARGSWGLSGRVVRGHKLVRHTCQTCLQSCPRTFSWQGESGASVLELRRCW